MRSRIHEQIHNKIVKRRKTIAVAESCTGGMLSCLLTDIPGSSKYFLLGIVAYSNKSKKTILNIPLKTITKYGAVSSEAAILMAKNIRKKINSDFGLSITGIAGPTGATLNKPIGTVFIGLSYKNINICQRFSFRGTRKEIRKKSVYRALRLLCAHL